MDTNHITRFDLHGANVRLLTDGHGETWFIAKDICAVLGLGNITEALRALDDDEKNSNDNSIDIAKNGGRATCGVANLYSIEVCDFVCVEDGAHVFGVGAKDVADVLGYSDANKAVAMHVDKEDRQNCQNDSFESTRGMTIINESGLYGLILSSKIPQARLWLIGAGLLPAPGMVPTGTGLDRTCTRPRP